MRLWFSGTQSVGFFFMGLKVPHRRFNERVILSKESQERRSSLGLCWQPGSPSVVVEGACKGRGAWDAGKKLPEGQPRRSFWERFYLREADLCNPTMHGAFFVRGAPHRHPHPHHVGWPAEGENRKSGTGIF